MKYLKLFLVILLLISSWNITSLTNPKTAKAYERDAGIASDGSLSGFLVKRDGTVWGIGENLNGRLGIGTKTASESTFKYLPGSSNVVKTVSNQNASYYLKDDGTVWGWGNMANENLGDGTTQQRITPTQIKDAANAGFLSNIVDISISKIEEGHLVAALDNKGEVYAWGVNYSEFFGGTISPLTPRKISGITGVVQVKAGIKSLMFVKSDGTLWTMGTNVMGEMGTTGGTSSSTPVQVTGISNVKSVATGEYNTAALKNDGTLWTWGANGSGVLGLGHKTNVTVPTQVPGLPKIREIRMGNTEMGVLDENGEVWTWGWNGNGQLGIGNTTEQSSPVKNTTLKDVVDFSIGSHSYAITTTGRIFGWGKNAYKQLSASIGASTAVPTEMFPRPAIADGIIKDVVQMESGYYHTLALKKDGTVWGWGRGLNGRLEGPTTTNHNRAYKMSITGVKKVATGHSTSFALKTDGTLWGWGKGSIGELGTATTADAVATPVKIEGLPIIKDVQPAINHVAALDETGQVWTWGSNNMRAVQPSSTNTGMIQIPYKVPGMADAIQVETGYSTTYVLKSDGTVWSWGLNDFGQLGNGTKVNSDIVQVLGGETGEPFLTNVEKIFAGESHVMALKKDGTLWSWGMNTNGQLGNNSTVEATTPVKIQIDGIKDVVTRGSHNVIVKYDGTVWGWGWNAHYQLALGDTTDRLVPTQIPTPTDSKKFTTGYANTFYITTNGTIKSLGYNPYGEAGVGTTVTQQTFTDVLETPPQTSQFMPFDNVMEISPGTTHTAGLKKDGTLWTWGNGTTTGKLGNTDWKTVTQILHANKTSLTNVVDVAATGDHTLAVKSDGTVWSWGTPGSYGKLGRPSTGTEGDILQVPLNAFITQVAVGFDHSLALDNQGNVWAWGYNAMKQAIPSNANSTISTPTKLTTITNVASIDAGYNHSVALKTDGTVWSWGSNLYGQLGAGAISSGPASPVQAVSTSGAGALTGIKQVSAGSYHTVAVGTNGTVYVWGQNETYNQLGLAISGNGKSKGPLTSNIPTTNGLSGVDKIYAGTDDTLVIKTDGTVWGWGDNFGNHMGGTTTLYTVPTQVTGVNSVRDVATTAYGGFYITSDDKVQVRGGSTVNGHQGDGTLSPTSTPKPVVQPYVAPPPVTEPVVNPLYFNLTKSVNQAKDAVTITMTPYNMVDGNGKIIKYENGTQTLGYFKDKGRIMGGTSLTVTENGSYTFYLKDARGQEWKETVIVTEISKFVQPYLLDNGKEYLVPKISAGTAKFPTRFSNLNENVEMVLKASIDGTDYGSSVTGTNSPVGDSVANTFNLNLASVAPVNEKKSITMTLEEKGKAFATESQPAFVEVYDPLLTATTDINSTSIEWTPSTLTNVTYVLKKDGQEIYRGTNNQFQDVDNVGGQSYTYVMEVVHEGVTQKAFEGIKTAASYAFQPFGDILMVQGSASPGSVVRGQTVERTTTSFQQTADVQKGYSVQMQMTPFRSMEGSEISASNFSLDRIRLTDANGNTLETKSIQFQDNLAVSLITESDTQFNKDVRLEAGPENFVLSIPENTPISNTSGETFESAITYQVQWAP